MAVHAFREPYRGVGQLRLVNAEAEHRLMRPNGVQLVGLSGTNRDIVGPTFSGHVDRLLSTTVGVSAPAANSMR